LIHDCPLLIVQHTVRCDVAHPALFHSRKNHCRSSAALSLAHTSAYERGLTPRGRLKIGELFAPSMLRDMPLSEDQLV
jgi:hypothetical protein